MSLEVERKFRVLLEPAAFAALPCLDLLVAWEVWQAYLTDADSDVEVRARRVREVVPDSLVDFEPTPAVDELGRQTVRRLMAIKRDIETTRTGGISRTEAEAPVDEEFFGAAWRAAEGRRLRKVRVEYMADLGPDGRRVVVVDSFRDRLEGLVLAEIEFELWAESTAFQPPDWLGREVTHDHRYRNAALAATAHPPG